MNYKTGIIALGVFATGTIAYLMCNESGKKNEASMVSWKKHDKYENNDKNYMEKIKYLRDQLDTAYQQLQKGEFRYALCDVNIVMKELMKLILDYTNGGDICEDLLTNLKIFEREYSYCVSPEVIRSLFEVYHICECDGRELIVENYVNHKKVLFAIMQIKDLIDFTEYNIISV